MKPRPFTTSYRHPSENLILALTVFLVGVIILITAAATICTSFLFAGAMFLMAYQGAQAMHARLLQGGTKIDASNAPKVAELFQISADRLGVYEYESFVVGSHVPNAYTFGVATPKVLVLHSALLERVDREELLFIIGHEMGHIHLKHTWLNSLIGGLAGIPTSSSASTLLLLAFRWWNRACEYSSDRAGLLINGNLEKAISALVKLVAEQPTEAAMQQAYREIDAQDDHWSGALSELVSTHPMLIRRIHHLKQFAASSEFKMYSQLMQQ